MRRECLLLSRARSVQMATAVVVTIDMSLFTGHKQAQPQGSYTWPLQRRDGHGAKMVSCSVEAIDTEILVSSLMCSKDCARRDVPPSRDRRGPCADASRTAAGAVSPRTTGTS